MAGATGLDWASVLRFLDEEGLRGRKRRECWACIREAEREVLQALDERRQRQRQQQG